MKFFQKLQEPEERSIKRSIMASTLPDQIAHKLDEPDFDLGVFYFSREWSPKLALILESKPCFDKPRFGKSIWGVG
jgi:hypothetical protein